jgi:hypothetical protein
MFGASFYVGQGGHSLESKDSSVINLFLKSFSLILEVMHVNGTLSKRFLLDKRQEGWTFFSLI